MTTNVQLRGTTGQADSQPEGARPAAAPLRAGKAPRRPSAEWDDGEFATHFLRWFAIAVLAWAAVIALGMLGAWLAMR